MTEAIYLLSIFLTYFMRKALLSITVFTAALNAAAIETPTMGWSSWNTYRVDISESIICRQADAMASSGLRDAGYTYINIDDGFFGGRDESGRLLIHAERFPRGLQPVVDHIHSLGFKAGIYSDAGRNTCGNFWDGDQAGVGVGFYGHDEDDARYYFDELGFDFIKIDFCGGDAGQNHEHLDLDERERYTAIRRAIDAVGRNDVRINVCRWAFPGTWVHSIGSSWRIAADISANWNAIKRIISANNYLSAYAGGGHYNDMDMLEIGRGLSDAEERTHFGMWCIMSSPLLIGCDLTTIPDKSKELISNPELIAINQDALGLQAHVVKTDASSGLTLYVKDIQTLHGTTRAVAIYNPSDSEQSFELNPADVDLAGTVDVRDLFARADLAPIAPEGSMNVTLAAHDTAIYLLSGEQRLEQTVYEAETAWLERFQKLGINPSQGYAEYASDPTCSGGARVGWLGNHPDNWLEWRDVWSIEGGVYDLTINYLQWNDRTVQLSVNGGEPQTVSLPAVQPNSNKMRSETVRVVLAPGSNTVRIANPSGWAPDLDYISVKPVDPSAIADVTTASATTAKTRKVICADGRLSLPESDSVSIWDMNGVRHTALAGATEISVTPGIYFLIY